jgi:hypothetical protein
MKSGLIACAALAALGVAPLSAHAQSVEDNLRTVRANITGQGTLAITYTTRDNSTGQGDVEHWTMVYDNVRYDAAACSLTFHAYFTADGKDLFNGELTYPINTVTEVRLWTAAQNMQANDANGGNGNVSVVADPGDYDIRITFVGGRMGGFYVQDSRAAQQTANAIASAATQCGSSVSRVGF